MRASLLFLLVVTRSTPLVAAVEPPTELSTKINGTGHAIVIPATLKDGDENAGDIPITIHPDDSVSVNRAGLEAALKPRVAPEVLTQLAAIDAGSTIIPVSKLTNVGGVEVAFNPGEIGLVLKKSARTTALTDVPMSRSGGTVPNHQPANVSAYMNITTAIDEVWDSPSGPPVNMDLIFEGAARVSSFVLEGEGRLDGPLDTFICPTTASCSFTHKSGFKRQGTRLVKEFDDANVVMTAGDISYAGYGVQRGNDVVGIGFAHDTARFGGNDRMTAATSVLQLETPADVEVMINGVLLEHLHLNTGTYRLSDLPLVTGSNNVTLLVFTADGETRTIQLTALSHNDLLKPGKSVWSVNAGAASFVRDAGRAYLIDDLVANGYFRYGLSSMLTADFHGQADAVVTMVGADLVMATPFGLFTVGLAASTPYAAPNTGYAVTLAWDYLPPTSPGDYQQNIHFGGQYESTAFQTPGDTLVGRGGILYATLDPVLLLSGSWSVAKGRDWAATASAQFALPNAHSPIPGSLETTTARWQGQLALTKPLSNELEGTLWCGYGNEHLLTFLSNINTTVDFTVGVRLSWQPKTRTSVTTEADTGLKSTSVYATTRSADDRWMAAVSAVDTENLDANTSASLTHNGRYEQTTLTQSVGYTGSLSAVRPTYEQTSLRSTTAIAYADGHIAVGPPIQDGFAIVTPHPSIASNEIIVGDADNPAARGTTWMPALITKLPSHVENQLAVDAINLPTGYSLGDASITVKPPYRAGYAIEVGSNHAMSAYGTLTDELGQPVSLVAGMATADGKPGIALFTNAAGRFGIDGLSPGRWSIAVPGPRGPLTYTLDVTPGASALVKAGTLAPHEKGDPPHAPWTTVTLPPPAAGDHIATR